MGLTDYEEKRITAAYESSGRNSPKAIKILKDEKVFVSKTTILRHWKKQGLELGQHGGKRKYDTNKIYFEKHKPILIAYPRYEGKIQLISANTGYREENVRVIIKRAISEGILEAIVKQD